MKFNKKILTLSCCKCLNTSSSYGSLSKFFHWFIAIGLLSLFIVGYNLDNFEIPMLKKAHKTIGFLGHIKDPIATDLHF